MECYVHPGQETLLRCSKCERPICGRCAVTTPVGARCPECARVQRLPTYSLPTPQMGAALAAAVVVGVGLGALLGLVDRMMPAGLFGGLYTAFAFVIAGYVSGEAVSRVSNRKRATPLQMLALLGYALSIIVFSLASGGLFIGLYSLVGMAVGAAMAVNPFR